jgi:hypothetical protein
MTTEPKLSLPTYEELCSGKVDEPVDNRFGNEPAHLTRMKRDMGGKGRILRLARPE